MCEQRSKSVGSSAFSSLDILQLPQSSLDVVHSDSQDVLVFFLLGHAHESLFLGTSYAALSREGCPHPGCIHRE